MLMKTPRETDTMAELLIRKILALYCRERYKPQQYINNLTILRVVDLADSV